MNNRKPFYLNPRFLVFVLVLICGTALTVSVWPSAASQKEKRADVKQREEEYFGPVVDYEADRNLNLTDAKENKLRQMKSARYHGRASQPLDEFESVGYAIHTHWAVGLPAIPVAQSDAVVLGRVVDARAYLTSDKLGVYSEFGIQVEKVYKNSGPEIKEAFIAEREGGVVRLSSGRTLPFMVNGQRLLRANRSYLLFLRRNEQGEEYHIVTGYEVGRERIVPLDELEQFAVFKGLDRTEFLKVVEEAVTEESKRKGRTN